MRQLFVMQIINWATEYSRKVLEDFIDIFAPEMLENISIFKRD